jgi:protein TonB
VILAHLGLAYLIWRNHSDAAGAPPDAVMIELAPVSDSEPSESLVEAPPGPLMTESEPDEVVEPEKMVVPDLPMMPKPLAVLTPTPKVKPVKQPKEIPHKRVIQPTHEKPAPRTTAPAHAASARASAGRQGSAGSSISPSTWVSQVHARIQSNHSSCPAGAHGTARVAFSFDRGGHILGVQLASSSGSGAVDQAALSAVRRSNPIPPPPPEIGGHVAVPVTCH